MADKHVKVYNNFNCGTDEKLEGLLCVVSHNEVDLTNIY